MICDLTTKETYFYLFDKSSFLKKKKRFIFEKEKETH